MQGLVHRRSPWWTRFVGKTGFWAVLAAAQRCTKPCLTVYREMGMRRSPGAWRCHRAGDPDAWAEPTLRLEVFFRQPGFCDTRLATEVFIFLVARPGNEILRRQIRNACSQRTVGWTPESTLLFSQSADSSTHMHKHSPRIQPWPPACAPSISCQTFNMRSARTRERSADARTPFFCSA